MKKRVSIKIISGLMAMFMCIYGYTTKVYCNTELMKVKEIKGKVTFSVLDSGAYYPQVVEVYSQYKEFYTFNSGKKTYKSRSVYTYCDVAGEYHKPSITTISPSHYNKKTGKTKSFNWDNGTAFFPTKDGLVYRVSNDSVTYTREETKSIIGNWKVILWCQGATFPTKLLSGEISFFK